MTRYCPFTKDSFDLLMSEMGFVEFPMSGVHEYVYQRIIHNGPFPSDRFAVRIYSTVDVRTQMTRENGADAIRIVLFDIKRQRSVLDWTTKRTFNAFANTKLRAKDAWGYVMKAEHHCATCSALMVERKSTRGSFLGCTNFPECHAVRQLEVV
jgi:hypothetical protein